MQIIRYHFSKILECLTDRLKRVRLDYRAEHLYIEASSEIEWRSRTNPVGKEPETIDWIQTFFKEDDTILEVGANIGMYSLVMASFLQNRCKIFALEPASFNVQKLRRNVGMNGFTSCIFPCAVALSDHIGFEWLYLSDTSHGSAEHGLGVEKAYGTIDFAPLAKEWVPVSTIDAFVEHAGSTPNHIKIDVDGDEDKILKGAVNTLKNPLLRSILIELGDQQTEMINYLQKFGFDVVKRVNKSKYVHDKKITFSNFIFERRRGFS